MNRRRAVVAGALVSVVALGVLGYAYVEGIGPLKEDPAAGLDEPPETENVYEMGGQGGGEEASVAEGEEGGDGVTKPTPPFEFEVGSIENCGRTCREVNAVLRNRMSVDAEGVSVYTWIYAGNTTERDDVVWADNREVGVLGGGETVGSTDRVNLSVQQAENVRENDGWITVEATVESRDEVAKFVTREKAG
ncbi:hypothetical protein EGH25_02760 [Haladaptatus sp. F3-133]|jgi:hypothetical protein|uniref:Uncharacterized protein n=1 Tax=Halorutilus salinus TaxID=2487751 RepID=A0A9Q4GHX9_9EURY|nr:hypothetical protein [Halorutilus salinus]MCX2818273.1 hypothetical protein [Halorutilus salinus]